MNTPRYHVHFNWNLQYFKTRVNNVALSTPKTSNTREYFLPGLLSVACVMTCAGRASQGGQATLGLGDRLGSLLVG